MENIIKSISAFILAIIVAINAFGSFIGIGDIIPTEPATTVIETTVPEESTTALDEAAVAEFIAFYNAETAKIAESGSYSLNRNGAYTEPIDVGSATDILNSIISAIDESSNLDSVVGYFLGIGTYKAEVPAADGYRVREDYLLKAGALQAGDITSFSEENGVYKFTLENATNPKKTGATALSRFTNDFVTHEEVVDGIAEFTSAITVTETNAEYSNINVEVVVSEGKITDIKYSYDFDADITLKAGVTINGTGSARTVGEYSNIAY